MPPLHHRDLTHGRAHLAQNSQNRVHGAHQLEIAIQVRPFTCNFQQRQDPRIPGDRRPLSIAACRPGVPVAEPPELSQLKCAGHHHKGNTDTNALQTEQFLVCRVTSRYSHRFSDQTSIPRTKASPEILQPHILQHKLSSYYKPIQKHYYRTKLSKTVIQDITLCKELKSSGKKTR